MAHRAPAVLRSAIAAVCLAATGLAEPLRAQLPGLPISIPGIGNVLGALGGGAQTVRDPWSLAQLVSQLKQQLQQIELAKSQLQSQLDNMRKLGRYNLRDVSSTLRAIDGLTQQGQAIWYALRDVDQQFQRTFSGTLPPTGATARLGTTLSAMPTTIRDQNTRTLATLRGAIAAANATAQEFATATAELTQLRGQLGAITGAQQASELQGLLGLHTAQEITLLRQQLTAQANAQAISLANAVNRDLQAAALADALRRDAAAAPLRRKDMRVEAVGFPGGGTP